MSQLPSVNVFCEVWKNEVNLTERATTILRAVSAGVVQPPEPTVSHDDDPYPSAALSQQDTSYEVKWKAEFVCGDGLFPSQNTSALNGMS